MEKIHHKIIEKTAEKQSQILFEELCASLLFENRDIPVIRSQMEGFELLDSIVKFVLENLDISNSEIDFENQIINALELLPRNIVFNFNKEQYPYRSNEERYLLTIYANLYNHNHLSFEFDFCNIDDIIKARSVFHSPTIPALTEGMISYCNKHNGYRNYHAHGFQHLNFVMKFSDYLYHLSTIREPYGHNINLASRGLKNLLNNKNYIA
jgi:hypothetical protein